MVKRKLINNYCENNKVRGIITKKAPGYYLTLFEIIVKINYFTKTSLFDWLKLPDFRV